MPTIVLIVMLLVGDGQFSKGQTLEIVLSKEAGNMVLTYQDDGWISVDMKKSQPNTHYISILIEDKFLTFRANDQEHKMPKDEFYKELELTEVDKPKGFDYVLKPHGGSIGSREANKIKSKMRTGKKRVITIESENTETIWTFQFHIQ